MWLNLLKAIFCTFCTYSGIGTLLVTAVILWYFYLTRNYGKFEKLGIFSLKPDLFFGNFKDLILQRKSLKEFHLDIYQKTKGHKCAIVYDGTEACLLVRDPELIKQVMIKDFDHFTDFGFLPNSLVQMRINDLGLANRTGESWRSLRAAITPAFSLAHLKSMMPVVSEIAANLVRHIKAKKAEEVNMDKACLAFTMDCITQTVFGIKVDAIDKQEDPGGNEWTRHAGNIFQAWRFGMATLAPWLMKLFQISLFNYRSIQFFTRIAHQVIAERDKSKQDEFPDDVIEKMMRLRDKSEVQGALDNDTIARTIMQFFLDGLDTVTTFLTALLYFLASHPEVQDKVFEEIDELQEKNSGQPLQGEEIHELKYLDWVVSEASRLGAFPFTARTCTKAWQLPGNSEVTIPVGMRVLLPIYGIHRDPEHFVDADKFLPERFWPENKTSIASGTFLPFGLGPRQCIGMRIARMEAKILVVHLLSNFRLELAARMSKDRLEFSKTSPGIQGGCWLKLVPR